MCLRCPGLSHKISHEWVLGPVLANHNTCIGERFPDVPEKIMHPTPEIQAFIAQALTISVREVVIYSDLPGIAELDGVSPTSEHFLIKAGLKEVIDDVVIVMTLGHGVSSDNTEVTFDLTHIDTYENGRHCFDTAVSTHNNDWASLRDQQAYLNAAIDYFYARGFDTKFGDLAG